MKLRIPLGRFDVVSFTGPDAIRFLNGQLTQDVRKVAGGSCAAFSCVTDAKGRLQFRVTLTAETNGTILVGVEEGLGEALEARLTRYLIADDVEATIAPAAMEIHHFLGEAPPEMADIISREISRFGESGWDWWVPAGVPAEPPTGYQSCEGDAYQTFRITRRIPTWGAEITEGILPPEARLEPSDISYQKGCYIGQEVISRIKSAGKVNRLLAQFEITGANASPGPITGPDGKEAGIITSIAPSSPCLALGFLKRNAPLDALHLGEASVRVI
jgi:tRNA-modifying protein YgfZ